MRMKMKKITLLGIWVALSVARTAFGAPKAVEVTTARVHLHDLGVNVPTIPDIDLGPAPALGSTRTIDRDDIVKALGAANAQGPTPKLAEQYRINRKSKRLEKSDLEKLVRDNVDPNRFTKGITFNGCRTPGAQVPDGYDKVTVELAALQKKSGTVNVTATVAFLTDNEISARITVPVELSVPAEALIPDVAKGGSITLVVKKGLVEVSIPATAAADGDLGTIVPIMLKPSGRIVRAKMIDKDHAVSVEES